jgi:hypothetical protein
MPPKNRRITTVVEEELADWLRQRSEAEGRSVSLVVHDIIAKSCADEEERFWARQGECRLTTFDWQTAISHKDAWD